MCVCVRARARACVRQEELDDELRREQMEDLTKEGGVLLGGWWQDLREEAPGAVQVPSERDTASLLKGRAKSGGLQVKNRKNFSMKHRGNVW